VHFVRLSVTGFTATSCVGTVACDSSLESLCFKDVQAKEIFSRLEEFGAEIAEKVLWDGDFGKMPVHG
jgi:hypothetical protein